MLDDALSVDTDTEAMILYALRDQASGTETRGTHYFAPPMSIMLADHRVLDNGRINQSGNVPRPKYPEIYQDLCRVRIAVQDEIDALVKPPGLGPHQTVERIVPVMLMPT